MPNRLKQIIADNLEHVRDRIASAAQRSGRTAADVRLVAATKYVSVEAALAVIEAGCTDLGESRPQQLWSKSEALASHQVRWHMIGHLQRNKIRRTLPIISLLHSVDSIRLLEALEAEASIAKGSTHVLLEVNVSGDGSKHGFMPAEMPTVIAALSRYHHVQATGLMAMAGLEGDLRDARREFARLRNLRDDLRGSAPSEVNLDHLSMGMSGDYEVAIEEGATLVRIGSSLFEGIESLTERTDESQKT